MKKKFISRTISAMMAALSVFTAVDVAAFGHANPVIVADGTMEAGQKVTYDCIYFGSYPQTELVKSGSAEEAALVTMNENFTTEYIVLSDSDFGVISSA